MLSSYCKLLKTLFMIIVAKNKISNFCRRTNIYFLWKKEVVLIFISSKSKLILYHVKSKYYTRDMSLSIFESKSTMDDRARVNLNFVDVLSQCTLVVCQVLIQYTIIQDMISGPFNPGFELHHHIYLLLVCLDWNFCYSLPYQPLLRNKQPAGISGL